MDKAEGSRIPYEARNSSSINLTIWPFSQIPESLITNNCQGTWFESLSPKTEKQKGIASRSMPGHMLYYTLYIIPPWPHDVRNISHSVAHYDRDRLLLFFSRDPSLFLSLDLDLRLSLERDRFFLSRDLWRYKISIFWRISDETSLYFKQTGIYVIDRIRLCQNGNQYAAKFWLL